MPVFVIKAEDHRISSRKHNSATEYRPLDKRFIPDDDNDCAGLADGLPLAIGARVMLRRNVLTKDSLVNGAMGTVQGFEFDEDSKPKVAFVKFDNIRVGKITRSNSYRSSLCANKKGVCCLHGKRRCFS